MILPDAPREWTTQQLSRIYDQVVACIPRGLQVPCPVDGAQLRVDLMPGFDGHREARVDCDDCHRCHHFKSIDFP